MNEQKFRFLYFELIEENPLAVRAALQVLEIEFTEEVPTLAVTCTDRPILKVNLGFVATHCRTEAEVKAVIVHEFLHILLRHTSSVGELTPARHLAADAVINAIIHRQLGEKYSDLMAHYYGDEEGIRRLLRRPTTAEWMRQIEPDADLVDRVWRGLYDGELCADDIEEVAKDLEASAPALADRLLGGHDSGAWLDDPDSPSGPGRKKLEEALDRALETMNGDGVWRSPFGRGVGAVAYESQVLQADQGVERWCASTFEILKRYVSPDSRGAIPRERSIEYVLPVLSSRDRRAALRASWSPFLPEARWSAIEPRSVGGTQVYLDVSGSMSVEMPLIVKLLGRLARFIQRPFWAFSNEIAPAVIENGKLIAATTGGTSMACVLEHLIATRPPAAVVVTDGYIEQLPKELVERASGTPLHAIITRDGSTRLLDQAGIPSTQLSEVPQ